jgi:hypothetical protein
MNWRVRSSCTLLAILSLTVAVASPSNAAAPNKYGVTSGDNGVPADASVTTDQAVGGYAIQVRTRSNGNGAGGATAATGGGADSCPGCKWAIFPACSLNSPEDQGNVMCTNGSSLCRVGQIRMRVMYMAPGDTFWTGQPSICSDGNTAPPAGAAPPLDITGAVRNYLESLPLPVPSPSFQPPGGTLVNLPTIFDAGSGPASPASFDLAGLHITVTPKPLRWTWTFEPGVTQTATLPGGTYPNKDVTYTYRTTGPRAVTVTAVWGATYRVNGGADQPVDGTVTRTSAPITVPVYEARSELVAGTG